jgi:lysozyme family protein
MQLTPELKNEYQQLFTTCAVRPNKVGEVDLIITRISLNRAKYEAVGNPMGIPWQFIAVIHNLESSLSFLKHLHNGDPLTGRTFQAPPGRPASGNPPFTWEFSAADALRLKNLEHRPDWSLAVMLFRLERYNGFGYRTLNTGVRSPYLWSFSFHYDKGKFVKDGVFSPTAVSAQCGAATLLRRMSDRGLITFPQPSVAAAPATS